MKRVILMVVIFSLPALLIAADTQELQHEIVRLQQQTQALQTQLNRLQKQLNTQIKKQQVSHAVKPNGVTKTKAVSKLTSVKPANQAASGKTGKTIVTTPLVVHSWNGDPDSIGFYPTALLANEQVVTYIAGTPVVGSPYLGARPAFNGSDYIVNIPSINRDIRLMQQRRRLYRAYDDLGYPAPNIPIIALSGKAEPIASVNRNYFNNTVTDFDLGSSEFDIAALLNNTVEAYLSVAYDQRPPLIGGPRVNNSAFQLNMGFVNIGNLDRTPFYFTAGQIYVPFGRFASAMVSAPLPQRLTRTKSRPFILGYKSRCDIGPYAAIYGFRSETTLGGLGVGGVNAGYNYKFFKAAGEIGLSYISSINDSPGFQNTGSQPYSTFGGFSSLTNGSENVAKISGIGAHWNLSIDRYNFIVEWVGAARSFRLGDLSFNGRRAKPQAGQIEASMTFTSFERPSSIGLGYQWTGDSLALNLPKQRWNMVYNISIWKDTVESLEFRHDIDYGINQFANGAAPPGMMNKNTVGTGRSANTLLAQIGVYF